MYSVLIADDEDYVRDLLVKNIRNSSLDITVSAVAGDGREALEAARHQPPDMVITDIAMPFMNGLELIRELQKAGFHCKYVVISGYDEFDYARQAISLGVTDYLLKPFLPRELLAVLEKLIKELDGQKALQQNMSLLREQASGRACLVREKGLKALLEGRGCPEEGEILTGEGKGSLADCFYMAGVLRLIGGAWNFSTQEGVEEFLVLVRDGYFASGIHMDAVSFDGVQLASVWYGSSKNEEAFIRQIHSGLEKISGSLKRYYQIRLQCAAGRPYTMEKELEKSYREAMAVWRGTLDGEKPILFYGEEDEKKEEVSSSSQIRDWKNQIRLSVGAGRKREAVEQLQGLMKAYASLANKKNDYISVSVGELVYALQNDLEHGGYEREAAEPSASMQDRIHYGSLMDMKEMLEAYIDKCCKVVVEHSEQTKAGAVVKQVKQLIENNLPNGAVDLEWVADKVHFSSSYVRQIFKQYTDESLGEYLIRKRMERAGQLLEKTSLRIQEIAEECGYDNQRYFASSFKKFYGCTPTEFKKTVNEEGQYS